MIILNQPKIEVKGIFVFFNNELLESKIFRYNEFSFNKGMEKSTRIVFSYTPIKRKGNYEYAILNITPSYGLSSFPIFACHECKEEEIMLLNGEVYCYSHSYNKNGTVNIYTAKAEKWQTYKVNGFLTIINKGLLNAVFLTKFRMPLKNTNEFEEKNGPPIIYKANEVIKNYNYLVWNTREMEKGNNLLKELQEILSRKFK